jgi:hypothetical protein
VSKENILGLGLANEDVGLLRGEYVTYWPQDLIEMIECSYKYVVTSSPEVHLERIPRLSMSSAHE